MAYTRTTWVNGVAPAINQTNLNNIEVGLVDAHAGLAAVVPAESYGFTRNANGLNVDAAWAALIAALESATQVGATVVFPPGLFVLTSGQVLDGVAGARFVGAGSGANWGGSNVSRYNATTFRWDGAGDGPMFTVDPGGGTLQNPPTWHHIAFSNNGPSTADGFKIDRSNNWGFDQCSWNDWDRAFWQEATTDNAHGWIRENLWRNNKYAIYGNVGYGMNIWGGNISGTTGAYGIYLAKDCQEVKIHGLKIDGCPNGGIYSEGYYCGFYGVILENCGDATHYGLDVQHNAGAAASGKYNCVIGGAIAGGGTELPVRYGAGANNNVHIGMALTGTTTDLVADSGSYNLILDVSTAQFGYDGLKPNLPDGSTLPNTIDALQTLRLVKP